MAISNKKISQLPTKAVILPADIITYLDSQTTDPSFKNKQTAISDLPLPVFWDRNAGSGFIFPKTLTDRVGIGTNSPLAKLDIRGRTHIQNTAPLVITDNTTTSNGTTVTNTSAKFTETLVIGDIVEESGNKRTVVAIISDTVITIDSAYPTDLTGNTLTRESAILTAKTDSNLLHFVVQAEGKVGIGLPSPTHQLHVKSGGTNVAKFETTASSGFVQIKAASSVQLDLTTGTGEFELHVGIIPSTTKPSFFILDDDAGSNRFTISGDTGFIGIGTTLPDAKLDIKEPTPIELSGTMQTGLVDVDLTFTQTASVAVNVEDFTSIGSLVVGSLVDTATDNANLDILETPLTIASLILVQYDTATSGTNSATGTMSIASGIVQGTTSLFTTELVVGDIIQSADGQTRRVTEIISNTALRVNTPFNPKLDFLSKLSRTITPFIIRDDANAVQIIATTEGKFGIGVSIPETELDILGKSRNTAKSTQLTGKVQSATQLPLQSIVSTGADTFVTVTISLTSGIRNGDIIDIVDASGFNETNRTVIDLIPNDSFNYFSASVKSSTPVTSGNVVASTELLNGTGTAFTTELVNGDRIRVGAVNYSVVGLIISDTQLELIHPFEPVITSDTDFFKLDDVAIFRDDQGVILGKITGVGEMVIGDSIPIATFEAIGLNPISGFFTSLSLRENQVIMDHTAKIRLSYTISNEPKYSTVISPHPTVNNIYNYQIINDANQTPVITIDGQTDSVGIGENPPEAKLEVSGGFGNLIRVSRTGNSGAHMAISNVGGAFGLGGIINSSIRVMATSFNGAIGLGLFARTDFSMQVNSLNSSGPAGMGALAELPHELLVAGSSHVRIAEKLMFGFFSGTIISVDITAVNTSFLNQLTIGDRIKVISTGGGQIRTVVAIADQTHLTIDSPWDVAFTNSTFNRLPSFVVEDNAKAVKFIINDLGHVGINTLNPTVPLEMKGGITIDLSGKMQDGLIDDNVTISTFEATFGLVTIITTLGSLVNGSLVDVTNAGNGSQNNATVSEIATSPNGFKYGVFPLNTTIFQTEAIVSIAAGIVQGTNTSFTTELVVGDVLITTTGQLRTVTEIISDTLIRVNAPFSPKLDFDSTLQKVIPHVLIRDINNNIQFSINHSGHVGIGNALPDPSAALDVESTNKGILFPRLTTAQKLLISSPATGLILFDTDKKSLAQRSAIEWRTLATNADTDHDVFSELDIGIESGGTVTIQSGRYVLKKGFTTPNKWKTAAGANVTIESFDRNNTIITYTGNGTFLDFTSVASATINNVQMILTDNAANLYTHSGGLFAGNTFFVDWTGGTVTGKIGNSTNGFAVVINNSIMTGFLNGITLENVQFSELSTLNWTSKGTGTGAMFAYKGTGQGHSLSGVARLAIGANETLIDAETTIVDGIAVFNIEKWNKVGTGNYFPTVTTKNITAFTQDGFPATSVTGNTDAGGGNGAELTKSGSPFIIPGGELAVLVDFTGDKTPYNGTRVVKINSGLEFRFDPPLAFITGLVGLGTIAYHRTRVTVIAHGYSNGQTVQIIGSDNNDGSFVISDVTTDTFDILSEFVATGTAFVRDGIDQKSPGVTVTDSVGVQDSMTFGEWLTTGNTTTFTPSGASYGAIVLGTPGSAAVGSTINERGELTNDVNGYLKHTGRKPKLVSVIGNLSVKKAAANALNFSFRLEIQKGGTGTFVAIDNVQIYPVTVLGSNVVTNLKTDDDILIEESDVIRIAVIADAGSAALEMNGTLKFRK